MPNKVTCKYPFMFMQDNHYTGNTVLTLSGLTSSTRMTCASRFCSPVSGQVSLVCSLQSMLILGNVSHPAFMAGKARKAIA